MFRKYFVPLSFICLMAASAWAQTSITCSSNDGRRNYCAADTRGGVQMVRQRSDSPCRQGSTWGYDRRGIWVDRGCRADFVVGNTRSGGGNYRPPVSTITCSSDDGRRHYCNADTRGGVSLTNQRSGSPCTLGYSWGYDQGGIWVDRGCRADFAVGGRRPGGSYRPPVNGGTITCSSDDGRRHYCNADTRGGVEMVNQRSGSPCRQGYSWGYDGRGIWVDRGCRADFVVGRGRPGGNYRPPVNGGTITCSSDDGKRHYCDADTRGGVTLVNQRSGSPCRQGSTWGYDRRGIWVDRGCRADFRLGR